MSDVNLATKSDLASLFQELEDAAKHAKKVINETPKEEPKVIEVADIVVEEPVIESPVVETKSLSIEDENSVRREITSPPPAAKPARRRPGRGLLASSSPSPRRSPRANRRCSHPYAPLLAFGMENRE